MLLIILNAVVLASGLIFVIIQYLNINASKRSLIHKLKIYVDGYWLSLIGFTSIFFSVLSSRPLLLTGDFKTVITAVGIAIIIYTALIVGWLYLKNQLAVEFKKKNTVKEKALFSTKLTKQFMNLTIYGLIYTFAVVFYVIVIISYCRGK